ncbi:MAG: hypothetical protein V3S14_14635 [Anaerolineae bacterium]
MSTKPQEIAREIGTLNEKPLHAALKKWYAQKGDQLEVSVDEFVVDIVRGDLLVEIQTTNFAAIKRKLAALTSHHPVRLVYPIAREKWIVKLAKDGNGQLGRRKSPKRGALEHVFGELVSFPHLLSNPNFSLDVLLIQEEEVRRYDGKRGWRRKGWVTHERRLLQVVDHRLFETPADMAALLPPGLVEPFTTSDLAAAIAKPRWLARKMAYCLRQMDAIAPVGKRGNAILYVRATPGTGK